MNGPIVNNTRDVHIFINFQDGLQSHVWYYVFFTWFRKLNLAWNACVYRPISSQTCCTVATAPGAAVVGRKQASSADQMAFWLISAVYRERFLLNGVFCSVFRLEVVRRLVWQSVGCRKRFLQLLLDVEAGRSVTGFADSSSGRDDMPYGNPTTTTTSTFDCD